MKLNLFILVLFLTVNTTFGTTPRNTEDFNSNWKFKLGDFPEAQNADFNDSDWRILNLPHDWSIEQNYTTENTAGSTAFLPAGIAWYRKTFFVSEEQKDLTKWIEFDGVYCNSEVWINGHCLGKRPFGYIPFGYRLSSFIKYGQENTISVRVDHSKYVDTRWYSGSGIYRNVRMVTTSKLHIPQFGAWIETPKVTVGKASVDISTVIKNEEEKERKVSVKIIIKDADGSDVTERIKKITSNDQDTVKLSLELKNPKLWSIDEPYIYSAEIQVFANKELMDVSSVDFGIRSIDFTADKGFFLNNENIKLRGVCLHHDAGAIGAVFIKDVWVRRLQRLKDIGVNAIRMAHNPADPELLKLCDEMGFVVINEAFDEWKRNKKKILTSRFSDDMWPDQEAGYGDIFEEWAERDVKDMVRYSRNHPSIIMWSIGNEIEWTYPYYYKIERSNQGLGNQVLIEETEGEREELKETAEQLQKWIKEIDNSRFVTTGGVLPRAGNVTGYFDVPDVMGYNYRAHHYDEDHANYPNRIIYGSENWGTFKEWKDTRDRDFVAGLFVWTGIAYLGESGPFPWKGLEISFLDFAGFYTPRGHFFKTLWNDEPSTYVATKHAKKAQWIYKNGKWVDNRVRFWLDKWLFEDVEETWNYAAGDSVFVEVFSNSPEVELFVNGKSFGIKSPADFEDNIAKYLVPYSAGEIKAIGLRDKKKESEFSIKTAANVNKIVLKADKTKLKANGYDVVHIEAFLLTADGNLVPDKEMQLLFNVEGEGKNIGVDNGWDRNVQKHKSNFIVTHKGKAIMYVQSTKNSGSIKISAQSGRLFSNSIIIETN